jgi:hypothetical protein
MFASLNMTRRSFYDLYAGRGPEVSSVDYCQKKAAPQKRLALLISGLIVLSDLS